MGNTRRMPLYHRAKIDHWCKKQDFPKTTCNADKDSVKHGWGTVTTSQNFQVQGYNRKKLQSTSNNGSLRLCGSHQHQCRQAAGNAHSRPFCREGYRAGIQVSGRLCSVYSQVLWWQEGNVSLVVRKWKIGNTEYDGEPGQSVVECRPIPREVVRCPG